MSHTRADVFARIVNVGHPFVEYDRRHELHQSPRAAGRDRIGVDAMGAADRWQDAASVTSLTRPRSCNGSWENYQAARCARLDSSDLPRRWVSVRARSSAGSGAAPSRVPENASSWKPCSSSRIQIAKEGREKVARAIEVMAKAGATAGLGLTAVGLFIPLAPIFGAALGSRPPR